MKLKLASADMATGVFSESSTIWWTVVNSEEDSIGGGPPGFGVAASLRPRKTSKLSVMCSAVNALDRQSAFSMIIVLVFRLPDW